MLTWPRLFRHFKINIKIFSIFSTWYDHIIHYVFCLSIFVSDMRDFFVILSFCHIKFHLSFFVQDISLLKSQCSSCHCEVDINLLIILVSSANLLILQLIPSWISIMYTIKSTRLNKEPWGTALFNPTPLCFPLLTTCCFLSGSQSFQGISGYAVKFNFIY